MYFLIKKNLDLRWINCFFKNPIIPHVRCSFFFSPQFGHLQNSHPSANTRLSYNSYQSDRVKVNRGERMPSLSPREHNKFCLLDSQPGMAVPSLGVKLSTYRWYTATNIILVSENILKMVVFIKYFLLWGYYKSNKILFTFFVEAFSFKFSYSTGS